MVLLRRLRRALATFAAGADETLENAAVDPLEDDQVAVADYAGSVKAARGHVEGLGFELELLMTRQRLEKLEPIAFAVGCVKRSDETRATFNVLVETMQARFRALFPHPDLTTYYAQHDAPCAIYNKLNEKRPVETLADYWRERAASRAQVETAILDHLYEELPEKAFDENEVRLLSARVLGLLMRPGHERHPH
ncbi:MAG: hypothetical protein J5X22_01495 [Candidatus Accumulibacter sp.]|uniref:Uncharacterized protein n=1 Tax=Candidatus Accumulibacter cognatus TaxID=2954383 RepID=A0A7D5NAR2_9PROT|nr:hypothetical protein [Accumulibacter sp.]MBN8519618.1 hypothetical protein [Accumulibacter sp.]MBO3709224.1 hypothetical protein [Accumulibacter sp.]QLH49787.1 MAG: hypothetical protein HWD57_08340 [Candidatus Accumulibacter cognatus]HNO59000.1 hypothetical protein [Accumulibacter sp.]